MLLLHFRPCCCLHATSKWKKKWTLCPWSRIGWELAWWLSRVVPLWLCRGWFLLLIRFSLLLPWCEDKVYGSNSAWRGLLPLLWLFFSCRNGLAVVYFVFELSDLLLELGVLAAEFIYGGFELFVSWFPQAILQLLWSSVLCMFRWSLVCCLFPWHHSFEKYSFISRSLLLWSSGRTGPLE